MFRLPVTKSVPEETSIDSPSVNSPETTRGKGDVTIIDPVDVNVEEASHPLGPGVPPTREAQFEESRVVAAKEYGERFSEGRKKSNPAIERSNIIRRRDR